MFHRLSLYILDLFKKLMKLMISVIMTSLPGHVLSLLAH